MSESKTESNFFKSLGIREKDLENQLQLARLQYSNSSIKGQDLEIALREFIDEWTPLRLRVGCGEVIDSFGKRSAQCDGVIINLHQPFWKDRNSNAVYLIEAVESIFEVKSSLNTAGLDDIIQKADLAEKLKIKHSQNDEIKSPWGATRFTDHPPFWAFAFEKSLSSNAILKKLNDSENSLDALFVLGQGSFVNLRDGGGQSQVRNPDGSIKTGWHFEEESPVLETLLQWLHAVLPQVERASPVIRNYFDTGEVG